MSDRRPELTFPHPRTDLRVPAATARSLNRTAFGVSAALAVTAALLTAAPAAAQLPELPTLEGLGVEYISRSGFFQLLLSGRLDIEGMHITNDWQPPDRGLGECDACHVDIARQMRAGDGALQTHRLRVFADIFLGDHIYSLVEMRRDRGLENFRARGRFRVEQAFVRVVDGSGSRGVQLGKFASPFGSYALRHLSDVDPFLSAPLPYDYRTVMNRWRNPVDAADFMGWKDWPRDEALPDAPSIWDVPYQWGATVFGRVGPVDLRVAAMNSAPSSHPRAWKLDSGGFERPSWVVGARWKASPSLEIGASYDRGPWLAGPLTEVLTSPPGEPTGTPPDDWRDFDQELISADIAFLRGPVMIRAEAVRDRWELPNVDGLPASVSASLEAQTDIAAGFFVAARGGLIDFRPFDDGSPGPPEDWDHDVYRYEGAVGYRLARNVGVLASAYKQVQSQADDGDTTFFGLRLWWAF